MTSKPIKKKTTNEEKEVQKGPLTKEEKIDEQFMEKFFYDLKEYNKKSNCSPYL